MTSIDLPSLMTTIFVLVDDWYCQQIALLPSPDRERDRN
jgi:hypothetical protein